MKNTFLFILGIVLSATLGMTLSTYAFTSDEDLLESLFSQAGITKTYNNDAKELENLAAASEDAVPFQNLYLFMLQNVMNGPQDAAIEALSKRYLGAQGVLVKYSEDELKQVVVDGNTQVIIDKYEVLAAELGAVEGGTNQEAAQAEADADMEEFQDSNEFSATTAGYLQWKYEQESQPPVNNSNAVQNVLTADGLFKEYSYLADLYGEELSFQAENRILSYEALANEMFYNNDLSDSADIDILFDLDIIHYLIFGEYITYPDRSGDEPVDLASDPSEELDLPEEGEGTGPAADAAVVLAEEEDVQTEASAAVDPYTCFESDEILAALEAYEEDPPEVADVEIGEESTIDYDLGEGDDQAESEATGQSEEEEGEEGEEEEAQTAASAAVDVGAAMEELDSFITALEGNGGDWTRSLPCDDTFCITVEFISEKDDPTVTYEATDNCIACHVAYISKRMEETTSKSLVPSKISMNWFEDATCKEVGSAINLDLNVYLIKKPIDLDPGDDIDTVPESDTDEVKMVLGSIGALYLGDMKKTALGETLGDKVCKAILSLGETGDFNRPIDEVLGQCQDAADQIKVDTAAVYEEFTYNAAAKPASDLYGQVSAELYAMFLQFKNFQQGLKDTYESKNAPLPALISKAYCP